MWMIWVGFTAFILGMLALDLGVFHRRSHVIRVREALIWSAIWISIALAFTLFVWFGYEHHWLGLGMTIDPVDGQMNDGKSATLKYLTAYVLEKSLSVDNLFVIAMIFGFLAVPAVYQHRVLFWGIIGALVLRGAMIAVGSQLVARYTWILYIFGAFLVITAIKMLIIKGHDDPTQNVVVRLAKRFLPVTDRFHGQHFLVRAGSTAASEAAVAGMPLQVDAAVERARPGQLMITPLFLALILVETTDVVFAVDSIPAVFAITGDPFLVYTSNVFAIMGLRSLYFALAGMLDRFRYLKVSLAIVLAIVGLKMLLHNQLKEALGSAFNLYLLVVIVVVLAAGVIGSLFSDPVVMPGPDAEDPKNPEKPASQDGEPPR